MSTPENVDLLQRHENSRLDTRTKNLTRNRDAILIILCCLAAFAFKLGLLAFRNGYIDPDEGYYLILARNLAAGAGYGFNGLPNVVFPPFLPILIAAVDLLVSNLRLSLNLITAFSGALLGWAAFRMMKKEGVSIHPLLAGVFVLFIPALNDFVPVQESYTRNLYRGSDILNALLTFSTAYLLVLAIRTNRLRYSILGGVVLGLAYLTRPEGILLLTLLAGWLLLLGILRFIRLPLKHVALVVCAFLIVASPYLIYLRTVTGRWTVSAKVDASRKYRESLMAVVKTDDWVPFSKYHYSLNREAEEMNDVYWGYHHGLESDSDLSFSTLVKNALENFRLGGMIPRTIFPLYLWVFAIPGLALGVRRVLKQRSLPDAVLVVVIPYSFAILALSYPIPRHHLFLTPVLCIYAVKGIEWTSSLLTRGREAGSILARRFPLMVGLIVLMLFAYGHLSNFNRSVLHEANFRNLIAVDENVSKYLQARSGNVLMSMHPRISIRTNSDWQVLPQTDLAEVLQFAKHKRVDYIVWPSRNIKNNLYILIDVKQSDLPADSKESLSFEILDHQPYFQLARIIPDRDRRKPENH
jgi:4-amino-4-deoxy-L-arabinose transferase-like glycosyltransferase